MIEIIGLIGTLLLTGYVLFVGLSFIWLGITSQIADGLSRLVIFVAGLPITAIGLYLSKQVITFFGYL